MFLATVVKNGKCQIRESKRGDTMREIAVSCALIFLITGCGGTLSSDSDYSSYFEEDMSFLSKPGSAPMESLFSSDEAILSGESIERILDAKVIIPKNARLAILHFDQYRDYFWWSEEFTEADEAIKRGFIEQLAISQRLDEVSLLPSMMTPEEKSIPYLREAAARCQADLLFVYRFTSRSYRKSKLFSPNTVKAKCMVEAILLDVRTGIVPFASVSSQEYEAKKSKEDYNFSETVAKAEMEATSKALKEIGSELVKFLESAP